MIQHYRQHQLIVTHTAEGLRCTVSYKGWQVYRRAEYECCDFSYMMCLLRSIVDAQLQQHKPWNYFNPWCWQLYLRDEVLGLH